MTRVEITTEYQPEMFRRGFPYRLSGRDFTFKSVCRSVRLSDDNIIGSQMQESYFRVANQDDPGWLMYILAGSTLDNAKHIAGNIMRKYIAQNLSAHWISNIGSFKWKPGTSLFVLDAMFEDDTAYRRSQFYDALMQTDGPQTSVILLGRSDDPLKFIKHIGVRPHMIINTK